MRRFSGLTSGRSLSTRDTVLTLTPHCRAISLMVIKRVSSPFFCHSKGAATLPVTFPTPYGPTLPTFVPSVNGNCDFLRISQFFVVFCCDFNGRPPPAERRCRTRPAPGCPAPAEARRQRPSPPSACRRTCRHIRPRSRRRGCAP